jgi:transcriptional regulator with XRE-family HTH domain
VPDLERLGQGLSILRRSVGLTQRNLAIGASLDPSTVHRIEVGRRRTRASTLARIAQVLVDAAPDVGHVDEVTSFLVMLAGSALAPESAFQERIDRRRQRREDKWRRESERWRPYRERMWRRQAFHRAEIDYRNEKKAARQRERLMTRGF